MADTSDNARLVSEKVMSADDSHHSSSNELSQHFSCNSVDLDTASITYPHTINNLQIGLDAEGDVFTVSRAGTLQITGEGDFDRCTPWQFTSADSFGDITAAPSMEEYAQFIGLDEKALVQAVVFLEDAYLYRSINHKVDESHLRLYRHYHSTAVYVIRWVVIFILHLLAFFESPSSLTWTSDLRYRGDRLEAPCWLLEGIEITCLLFLILDNLTRAYLLGKYYFVRHKWDLAALVFLLVSVADWAVSALFGCTEVVRFRRLLRPYFIIQNSSLMKKIVNCLRMTMPEVISVLVMLCMHLYIFTLFGMLLFPTPENSDRQRENRTDHRHGSETGVFDSVNVTDSPINPAPNVEGKQYFSSLLDSFMSLLVLLTTANNPDVTMPAYSRNRLFAIFFMVFLIIGLYCFFNMLTAVIYNQFRGYFLSSMQSSLSRRRLGVRAAFEVLRRKKSMLNHHSLSSISNGVGGFVIKSVLEKVMLPNPIKEAIMEKVSEHPEKIYFSKDFQLLFLNLDMEIKPPSEVAVRWFERPNFRRVQRVIVHKYFSYFGIFVALCNVLVITAELATEFAESFDDSSSDMRVVNFAFANYYVLEQLLKLWANGPRRYIHFRSNIFDAVITLALVVGEMYSAIKFGIPFSYSKNDLTNISTLWNVLRIINILIMVRLLKVIHFFKSMRVITSVLLDLVSNMKAFAGVLIVIYYVFAILGMELFHGAISYNNATDGNRTFECGSYRQLQYWANNFDDFAAALVVLWDVMVVNNWMVFLEAYRGATSAWAYIYFVTWWLISVIIIMNLFTALIMENFIMKWDRSQQMRTQDESFYHPVTLNSVHDLFRGMLKEPADNELLMELCLHQHLTLER